MLIPGTGPEKLLEVWFSPSPEDLPASVNPNGLKNVATEEWKVMLDLVNCKVLSVVDSEHVDAYLLSESSLFVFPHKLILKTCGTTTLLSGLSKMLEIAARSAGFPSDPSVSHRGLASTAVPYRVFYSRKNFLYPDKQRGPHRNWAEEVRFLDHMFKGGSAYLVGKMNGEHWYLYITGPDKSLTPPTTPEWEKHVKDEVATRVFKDISDQSVLPLDTNQPQLLEDETLEILMTDLDPQQAKLFYLDHANAVAADPVRQYGRRARQQIIGSVAAEQRGAFEHSQEDIDDIFSNWSAELGGGSDPSVISTEGHVLGTVVSESSGLSEIYPNSRYPDARIDAYLFSPCGFSANGVIPAPAQGRSLATTHYFTVHVTPESHCSYASFETNVPSRQTGRETAEVVERVVKIFRPGRFSVTLFEAKPVPSTYETAFTANREVSALATARRSARMEGIDGYRRVERIVHDLDGYDLVFRHYEREGWKGGAPRLGETPVS